MGSHHDGRERYNISFCDKSSGDVRAIPTTITTVITTRAKNGILGVSVKEHEAGAKEKRGKARNTTKRGLKNIKRKRKRSGSETRVAHLRKLLSTLLRK